MTLSMMASFALRRQCVVSDGEAFASLQDLRMDFEWRFDT